MATPLALVWDLIARDNASATFTRVGASAEKAGVQTEAAGKKLAGVAKGLGALALVDAGVHMVKMAGDFQQSTNVLVTAAGETTANLGLIRSGIKNIATTTGTDWKQVVDGMYLLEKAGYRGADALKVEMAAAQGAREENASLATVTQAMTSIMASYHLGASDSVMVMNELKTAAGESKTTMETFAGSLSTVLPIASASKVSFADVAGSLATLTQHGTSADEATQELSNTIRNLAAPNSVAVKEMAQLGISSVDVSKKLGDGPGGRGLAGTLNYLSQTVLQKMGPAGTVLLNTFNQSKVATQDAATMFAALPPAVQKIAKSYEDGTLSLKDWRTSLKALPGDQAALASQWKTTEDSAKGFQSTLKTGLSQNQTYTDAIKKMTGGANGLNTTLQITGESMAGTNARIKTIADSAKGAGSNVSGWESTQKLFNVQFDRFKQTAEVAGIDLGTKLLPALSSIATFIANHQTMVEGFVLAFAGLATTIGALKAAHAAWDAATVITQGIQRIFGGSVRAEIDKTILKEGELAVAAKGANDAVAGRGAGGVGGAAGGAGGAARTGGSLLHPSDLTGALGPLSVLAAGGVALSAEEKAHAGKHKSLADKILGFTGLFNSAHVYGATPTLPNDGSGGGGDVKTATVDLYAFTQGLDRCWGKLGNLTGELKKTHGAFDENAKIMVENTLAASGVYNASSLLGISQDLVTKATMGDAGAQTQLNTQITNLLQPLENAKLAHGKLTTAQQNEYDALQTLAAGQKNASGQVADATEKYKAGALAAQSHTTKVDGLRDSVYGLGRKLRDLPPMTAPEVVLKDQQAKAALDAFNTAFFGLKGAVVDTFIRANYVTNAQGGTSFKGPSLNGTMNLGAPVGKHARGGFLGKGWNLVGEDGAELISPTGEVYPAGDTKRMRGGNQPSIVQNFYQQPNHDMRQLAVDSSRRIAMAMK